MKNKNKCSQLPQEHNSTTVQRQHQHSNKTAQQQNSTVTLLSLLRDFPDFYQKLYNLLEPSVLHAKYRARFFHLADLFLSSRFDSAPSASRSA